MRGRGGRGWGGGEVEEEEEEGNGELTARARDRSGVAGRHAPSLAFFPPKAVTQKFPSKDIFKQLHVPAHKEETHYITEMYTYTHTYPAKSFILSTQSTLLPFFSN